MPTPLKTRPAALTATLALIGGFVLLSGCTPAETPTTAPSPTAAARHDASGHAGMDHGGTAAMSHEMGTKGVEALKALKGKEFDVAYLSQMIAHHEAAVTMAEQALKNAQKEETKREARNVVDAQKKEIGQMTAWLKEWYGVAPDAKQQALVREDMQGMMSMPITGDRMFFEMMIPHHQGAIDMSRLVPERSERTEVRELAGQIIKAQEAEIKTYRTLMAQGN
ncbi:MAG TPA: DUF305 domain-containing protein [Armatimonadaceae bacterium]|nr:DUF305 domain-containing protein [Armatimonadaceae bacterium]